MKNGQSRVVIENVQPQVDAGLYPAKRTVGERVDVTADIFSDGHDHIRAEVLFRFRGDETWKTLELVHEGNDKWWAYFYVEKIGTYQFKVQAWIDHFETWYDGIKKKIKAKQDVALELLEGAEYFTVLSQEDQTLAILTDRLKNKSKYEENVAWLVEEEFGEIVLKHPLRQNVSNFETLREIKVESKKALFSSWYELFPRSASLKSDQHGTLSDTIKLLPRIAAMHFDVLYLPPIHPIGKLNRKGKNNSVTAKTGEPGSPWAVGSEDGGHKSIHRQLGTLEDFKKLLQEAEKTNVDLAMDIAFQCAPDHPYVKEHPEWFKQRPDGSVQYAENPPKKYQDIYPFDFECENWKALWDELKSVVEFWISQGIKIFRVDNPHTKPIPFWKWLIGEINSKHPEIIFLSEAFTRQKVMASLAKVGFTQSYTYFTWRVSKQEITDYMIELVNAPSRNYFRPNFWSNTPDILPWHLQYQGENIFIIRFALAATLSSSYGIYGPAFEHLDNQPIEGREEYINSEKFEIKTHDWRKANRMTDIIALVNKARYENAALQSTWNLHFCQIENTNLIAYLKATDDLSSIILVVVTLDPNRKQSGYLQVPKWVLKLKEKINLKISDLMTSENFTWTQEWNYVELNPDKMPFHLFKVEIFESQM